MDLFICILKKTTKPEGSGNGLATARVSASSNFCSCNWTNCNQAGYESNCYLTVAVETPNLNTKEAKTKVSKRVRAEKESKDYRNRMDIGKTKEKKQSSKKDYDANRQVSQWCDVSHFARLQDTWKRNLETKNKNRTRWREIGEEEKRLSWEKE